MKERSNLLFYPVLCVVVIYALYLHFHGEPFFNKQRVYINDYIFYSGAGLLALAYLINLIDRYSALLLFTFQKNKMNFVFDHPLSNTALSWTHLTFGISITVSLLLGVLLSFITTDEAPATFYPGTVVLFSGGEKLVYFFVSRQRKLFRAGMNKNVLIVNYGTLGVYSFHRLKSVEKKYDELLFIYHSGKVKNIKKNLVDDVYMKDFYSRLSEIAGEKGFYFSEYALVR